MIIKPLKNLLILAILIRFLLIPFYFHPDIKTTHFQTSFLGQGVFDIYKYIDKNKETLRFKEDFTYFPLTYFVLGGYQILASPLLGSGFYSWINDASTQIVSETIGIHRFLFILKFPYLIFDIATAFVLMSFFKDVKDKKRVFTFWLFNPFTIILIYIFSNFDIIPVFLTVVSLSLARKNKLVFSGIALGVAAGFKAYPILFLPFLLLYCKNLKQVLLTTLATFLTTLVIILPFISPSFQKEALVSGLTTRLFFPGVSIGFGETIMAGVVALSSLFFFGQLHKEKSTTDIWKYYLAFLLLLFSFIHFHISWLLWLAPFMVLLVTYYNRYIFVTFILALLAFAIPMLYEDRSMSVGLLSVYSSMYNWLPLPFAFVQKVYDPYVVQSILHSSIIGGSLVLIWQIFKEKEA